MPKHIHADLIKAWADGAEIEELDWRGQWCINDEPFWDSRTQYRIKPKPPVVLAGIEVPKPTREGGWVVDFDSFKGGGFCVKEMRVCGGCGGFYVLAGLAHSTKENAQAHADALNAFHKQLLES